MDEKTNEPEKTQGPVCTFCYKWCPRMLMLIGILVIICNISHVCLGEPRQIVAPFWEPDPTGRPNYTLLVDGLMFAFLFISVITTILTLFTLILKLLRARI